MKNIILNGRPRSLPQNQLSYSELVMLAAGPVGKTDERVFTATYFKGPALYRDGSLSAGESVQLKNGMVFTVVQTNKA
jgi:hypothetical protein